MQLPNHDELCLLVGALQSADITTRALMIYLFLLCAGSALVLQVAFI